jgi:hypothetical protein
VDCYVAPKREVNDSIANDSIAVKPEDENNTDEFKIN